MNSPMYIPVPGTRVAITRQPRDPKAVTLVKQDDPNVYLHWRFAAMVEPYFTQDPADAAYFETDAAAANAARDKDFVFMRTN